MGIFAEIKEELSIEQAVSKVYPRYLDDSGDCKSCSLYYTGKCQFILSLRNNEDSNSYDSHWMTKPDWE